MPCQAVDSQIDAQSHESAMGTLLGRTPGAGGATTAVISLTQGLAFPTRPTRPDLAAAGRRRSLCGQLGRQLFWCPGAAAAANRTVRRLPGQRKRHGSRHARHSPWCNL